MSDITRDEIIEAVKAALAQTDLGPSDNEDVMLTFYDLIPEEWIGGNDDRADVFDRLARNIGFAVSCVLIEKLTPAADHKGA